MKKFTGLLLGSSLLFGSMGLATAQDKPAGMPAPPKVLVIFREFLKPGKAGSTHEKTESAFVQAFTRAKWPTHYLTIDSLSGKPRSLFLIGYDSFDAWEKDNQATQKNTALSSALERAAAADGELLSDYDAGVFTLKEEYSLHIPVDIPHMRYFEITRFQVKPGHDKDFDELAKMYVAAYDKIPDVHWATFQGVYGPEGNTYLIFTPMKSASEIDKSFVTGKQVQDAMGAEGGKKAAELSAAAIETSQTNLFIFNPRISYVQDEWIKADPDFWKPKAAAATAPKQSPEKPPSNQ
jgi:hypothetical protein